MAIISIGNVTYGSKIPAFQNLYATPNRTRTVKDLGLLTLIKILLPEIFQVYDLSFGNTVTTDGSYTDSNILEKSTPKRYGYKFGQVISGLQQASYQFWS